MGRYDLLLAGRGLFYGCCECDLLLAGCCECDLFLVRCGWVGMSVTFFWLGVGECDLLLAWCV